MLTLSLSLLLCLQGTPVHAELHPKNADVYVEFGDSTVVWPALDQSPLARFLRDEKLKPLFAMIGQTSEGDLRGRIQGFLTGAKPEWKFETWFPGAKSVSFSSVVLGPATETRPSFAGLMVADFASAEQAKALADAFAAQAQKAEPHTQPGVQRLLAAKPAEETWTLHEGTRLVVGNVASLPEDFRARAAKTSAGIAQAELFRKFAQLDAPKGTVIGWLLVARPLAELLKATSDYEDNAGAFLEKLPSDLNPFSSPKVARLALCDGRYVTEMLSPPMPGDSDKTVDPAWLDQVPGEAMLVYSSPFDPVAAAKTVRALLATSEESAATLAALEQKLGYGLERVFAHLGPGMTTYMGPLASLGLPEARAYVDCADPAAFTKDLEAFVTALGESMQGVGAKTKGYKVKPAGAEEKIEIPITTISLPPEFSQNPMLSISPSFAPLGSKLVFALSSMDVKSELKRVIGGENGGVVPGTHPLAKAGFQVPAGAQSVVMMDWAKLLSGVIGMAKAFLPMSGMQLPFDLETLPTAEEIARYFPPTFHYARRTEHGIYRRNEGSFGPETWVGIFGGAFAAAGMRQAQAEPFVYNVGDEPAAGDGTVETAPVPPGEPK